MPGIVISTKKRILLDKKIKEVQVPSGVLDTALYYGDLPAMGVNPSIPTLDYELGRLPTIVKNEASMALVYGAITNGKTYGINGDTKSVEGFTFSRNSGATRWAFDGKIYQAATNELRPFSDPKSGTFKGILFEKASTNLSLFSGLTRGLADLNSYSNGYVFSSDTLWNKGTLLEKGIKLVKNASASIYAYRSYTDVSLNKNYVFSCFVRASDGLSPIGGMGVHLFGVSANNFNFEDLGGGVYRVWITTILTTVPNTIFGVYKAAQGDEREIIATGYQLEEGTVPTSYIPTDTAQVSRLSDVLVSNQPLSIYQFNSLHLVSDPVTGWSGNYDIIGRNLVSNSNSSQLIFNGYGGATIQRSSNLEVTEWFTKNANRVISSGGTAGPRVVQMFGTPATGEAVSVSGYFKNNGTKDILVLSNQGSRQVTLAPNEQKYIKFENIIGNGFGSVQFQVNPILIDDNVDFTWWRLKYEKGPLCTPYSVNPSDFVKVIGDGTVEISTIDSVTIRSFSIVPRKLNIGEF